MPAFVPSGGTPELLPIRPLGVCPCIRRGEVKFWGLFRFVGKLLGSGGPHRSYVGIIVLFLDPISAVDQMEGDQKSERADAVAKLLERFNRQFPQISYELVASPMLINAQALVLPGRRIVKLYGGLAFHSLIDIDALTFVLLHETGHHLAGGTRLPWNPFLACECQADIWAQAQAASWTSECTLNLQKALSDLDAVLTRETNNPQRSSITLSKDLNGCWSTDWQKRSKALRSLKTRDFDHACPLGDVLLSAVTSQSHVCSR
jgi:hypothetical protein